MKNKMRLLLSIFCFTGLLPLSWADETSPVGKWKTIDDNTGKPKSVVEISAVDGKLMGKIVELFLRPDENQNPLCDKCSGESKNQPIKGLSVLWDMQKDDSEWNKGQVLDPENGKIYKCKMKLHLNGARLEVRGFIGFSFIGRSQTWERLK
jgi:uncharacterized protein (DUF2147 family)